MNEQNKLFYPLNGFEMMCLNPDAEIITYDKLNNIFDLNDLFKGKDKIIILYLLNSRSSGHWVCLFKNHQGINFFDSYGKLPDVEIDNLTIEQRDEYNVKQNRLKEILAKYTVYYNNICLQGKKTQVCGCYVSHRLINKDLTEDEYINTFIEYEIKDTDEFVADYCLKNLRRLKYA
jgi:hypothetical protein